MIQMGHPGKQGFVMMMNPMKDVNAICQMTINYNTRVPIEETSGALKLNKNSSTDLLNY